MKALLPSYCRPLGYVLLVLCVFMPFLLVIAGQVTDSNLLFYKECIKLLMMVGALMILFALSKNECKATEQIRANAARAAMFITVLYVFGMMLYKVASSEVVSVDNSSFLTYLIINVICLEYGMKRAKVDNIFNK